MMDMNIGLTWVGKRRKKKIISFQMIKEINEIDNEDMQDDWLSEEDEL